MDASLYVGQSVTAVIPMTDKRIHHFGHYVSGDLNPVHFDDEYAGQTRFGGRIAHGLISVSFISKLLGMDMPGEGTIWLEEHSHFRKEVRPGDDVQVTVTITDIVRNPKGSYVMYQAICEVKGERVVDHNGKVFVQRRPQSAQAAA